MGDFEMTFPIGDIPLRNLSKNANGNTKGEFFRNDRLTGFLLP